MHTKYWAQSKLQSKFNNNKWKNIKKKTQYSSKIHLKKNCSKQIWYWVIEYYHYLVILISIILSYLPFDTKNEIEMVCFKIRKITDLQFRHSILCCRRWIKFMCSQIRRRQLNENWETTRHTYREVLNLRPYWRAVPRTVFEWAR